MICPNCKTDLAGGLIYDTFMAQYNDEKTALETAALYGATKTEGRWGREIRLYDIYLDRTVGYKCLECGHEWSKL